MAELKTWAYTKDNPTPLLSAILTDLIPDVSIIPFDENAADRFGRLRANQIRSGALTNQVDLLIAAIAMEYNMTLVTNNSSDFATIPDLQLVDWLAN